MPHIVPSTLRILIASILVMGTGPAFAAKSSQNDKAKTKSSKSSKSSRGSSRPTSGRSGGDSRYSDGSRPGIANGGPDAVAGDYDSNGDRPSWGRGSSSWDAGSGGNMPLFREQSRNESSLMAEQSIDQTVERFSLLSNSDQEQVLAHATVNVAALAAAGAVVVVSPLLSQMASNFSKVVRIARGSGVVAVVTAFLPDSLFAAESPENFEYYLLPENFKKLATREDLRDYALTVIPGVAELVLQVEKLTPENL